MEQFFQACYGHSDTGWTVLNTSQDIPRELEEDCLSMERRNAGLVAGTKVSMGENETPSCMLEIYCRNNAAGLVRTQYSLSDGQGRPVSFSHGYLIPRAYELLKDPNNLLRITKGNFADQRIPREEKAMLGFVPGALNRELIRISGLEEIPDRFMLEEAYSYESALRVCNLSEKAYHTYIVALYAYLFSTDAEKNLYIKTDGSEKYAWNLLYLTYLAVPYSMRVLLSASTYVRAEQHNSKLIFCYELPDGVPQIDPVTGINNVMSETVEKRTRERNPFITAGLSYVACGKQDHFFTALESCLRLMGDVRLNTLPVMNLAYSICKREYDVPERLPGLLYSWLVLPVHNTEDWENAVCFLLKKTADYAAEPGVEVKKILRSRLERAVTEKFKVRIGQYLTSADERKETDGEKSVTEDI